MANIWIGDLRAEQIKNYCSSIQKQSQDDSGEATTTNSAVNDIFITDSNADYSWFKNISIDLLANESKNAVYNVIIYTGLTDCINSCIWNSIDIEKIAENYVKTLDEISGVFTNCTFYFCSVNPVSDDYASNYVESAAIDTADINKAIVVFNENIQKSTGITYIDCHDYLINTGFDTYSCVHYTLNTCKNIYTFITDKFTTSTYTSFEPDKIRSTEESAPDPTEPSFIYWTTEYNECIEAKIGSGCVLPNCVGYAWGRFMEIMSGNTPKLSRGSAGKWWTFNDGYERGQEPRVGAVICWEEPGDDGHVAIVEEYDATTGLIITSESAWKDSRPTYNPVDHFFVTKRVFDKNKNNWRKADEYGKPTASWIDNYNFQGFIYCPVTIGTTTTSITKEELCTRNSYEISTEEMKPNAQYIWQYLGSRGWTLNAVAGLLGNIQQESKMSPCVWESLVDGSIIGADGKHTLNKQALQRYYDAIVKDKYGNEKKRNRYPGYGLVQWTSYTKLYNWCNDGVKNGTGTKLPYWDIDSQLQRIIYEVDNGIQWALAKYNYSYTYKGKKFKGFTFKDFIVSTEDPGWLAAAFAFCYEKPGRSSGSASEKLDLCTERDEYATSWYQYLSGYAVTGLQNFNLSVNSFKIDTLYPTEATASFVVRNIQSGHITTYELSGGSKDNGDLTFTDGFVTFDLKKLIPNKEYTLTLTIKSESDKEVFSEELSFRTPQDYPRSVRPVKFELSEEKMLKSINSKFNLEIPKSGSLGYWKKNSSGYDIQLIVNNKCVKSITEDIKNISWSKFKIKDKFGYTCKTGDTVQIGVRVWVKDDSGKKIYDTEDKVVKTSKPICLLNKPVVAYLNTN